MEPKYKAHIVKIYDPSNRVTSVKEDENVVSLRGIIIMRIINLLLLLIALILFSSCENNRESAFISSAKEYLNTEQVEVKEGNKILIRVYNSDIRPKELDVSSSIIAKMYFDSVLSFKSVLDSRKLIEVGFINDSIESSFSYEIEAIIAEQRSLKLITRLLEAILNNKTDNLSFVSHDSYEKVQTEMSNRVGKIKSINSFGFKVINNNRLRTFIQIEYDEEGSVLLGYYFDSDRNRIIDFGTVEFPY